MLTFISVVLTVVLFWVSQERRDLLYYRQPTDAVVLAAGTTSVLSTTLDGKPLSQDVSAAQVTFWNAGNKPIDGASVLEPIAIQLEPPARILDVAIRGESRSAIGLRVLDEHEPGAAVLQWRTLEPNDGATIQVVYVGSPGRGLRLRGAAEGASIRVAHVNSGINPTGQKIIKTFSAAGPFVLVIMYSMMTILFIVRRPVLVRRTKHGRRRIIDVIIGVTVLGLTYSIVQLVQTVRLDALPSFDSRTVVQRLTSAPAPPPPSSSASARTGGADSPTP